MVINKDISSSTCYVSHGVLPHAFDPRQPPATKRPFVTMLDQPYTHKVELILSEELYSTIWKAAERKIAHVEYARVIMPLSALLEDEFFNSYIKKGNIIMLSEGRPGLDELYSIRDGLLRLEMSKALYERSGLNGKPIPDGGRKHLKTRYAVEINLRSPSMLHGKKGFGRIEWVFKNVLTKSLTWLFHDLDGTNVEKESSRHLLSQHHPTVRLSSPRTTKTEGVFVPEPFASHVLSSTLDFEDWATSWHEWISLIVLESARILWNDQIDSYLCRPIVSGTDTSVSSIVLLEWNGLLPSRWIRDMFIELCTLSAKTKLSRGTSWFSLSAHAFHGQDHDGQAGYTALWVPEGLLDTSDSQHGAESGEENTLRPARHEYVLWEFSKVLHVTG